MHIISWECTHSKVQVVLVFQSRSAYKSLWKWLGFFSSDALSMSLKLWFVDFWSWCRAGFAASVNEQQKINLAFSVASRVWCHANPQRDCRSWAWLFTSHVCSSSFMMSCSRNACCGFQLVHFTAVNCEVIMGFVSLPLHLLLLYSGVRETGRNLDHFPLLMLREDLLLHSKKKRTFVNSCCNMCSCDIFTFWFNSTSQPCGGVFFWASFLSIAHLVCGALTICVKAKGFASPPT